MAQANNNLIRKQKRAATARMTAPADVVGMSAGFKVPDSGYQLVRKRNVPAGKIASAEDIAAIDFKPWPRDPEIRAGEFFPDNATLLNCLVPARMACGVVFRTKNELIDMHDTVGLKSIEQMLDSMTDAAETLKAIAHMIDAAYLRVLSAGAAHALRQRKSRRRAGSKKTRSE